MNTRQNKLVKAFLGLYGTKAETKPSEYLKHSTTDLVVLAYIAQSDGRWSEISDIRKVVVTESRLCSPGTLSKSIERLQDMGLIEEAPSPTGDSRKKIARTTERGNELFKSFRLGMN